jgi:hypothetical protein
MGAESCRSLGWSWVVSIADGSIVVSGEGDRSGKGVHGETVAKRARRRMRVERRSNLDRAHERFVRGL